MGWRGSKQDREGGLRAAETVADMTRVLTRREGAEADSEKAL